MRAPSSHCHFKWDHYNRKWTIRVPVCTLSLPKYDFTIIDNCTHDESRKHSVSWQQHWEMLLLFLSRLLPFLSRLLLFLSRSLPFLSRSLLFLSRLLPFLSILLPFLSLLFLSRLLSNWKYTVIPWFRGIRRTLLGRQAFVQSKRY